MKKGILLASFVIFILVSLNVGFAQDCDVSDMKNVLKKALHDYIPSPELSKLSADEMQDLLSFYLNASNETSVRCDIKPTTADDNSYETMVKKFDNETKNSTIPYCIDGTHYGDCSMRKPQYCFNGLLVNRCRFCGCPGGYECLIEERMELDIHEGRWGRCVPIIEEKKCVDLGGYVCNEGEYCFGKWIEATDTPRCCSEECKPAQDIIKIFGDGFRGFPAFNVVSTENPYYGWSAYSSSMDCVQGTSYWGYKTEYQDKSIVVFSKAIQKKFVVPAGLSDYNICVDAQSFCNNDIEDKGCSNGVAIGLADSNMNKIRVIASPYSYYTNCGPGWTGSGFAWGGRLCLDVSLYANPGDEIYLRVGSQQAYIHNVTIGGIAFEEFGGEPNLSCSDGTLNGQCSVTKPWYCGNGALFSDCQKCGCLDKYTCQTNGSCLAPVMCTDGTYPDECSVTKPWYCGNGALFSDCQKCGCPTNYVCQSNNSCAPPGQPVCNADTDCGISNFTGDYYCNFDGDVFRNYTNYSCLYPGTVDSECREFTGSDLIDVCMVDEICVDGMSECQENITSCIDYDGGLNYYVKSYATNGRQTQFDVCREQTGANLVEGFCDGNEPKGRPYMCSYGCEDGKCNEAPVTGKYAIDVNSARIWDKIGGSSNACGYGWDWPFSFFFRFNPITNTYDKVLACDDIVEDCYGFYWDGRAYGRDDPGFPEPDNYGWSSYDSDNKMYRNAIDSYCLFIHNASTFASTGQICHWVNRPYFTTVKGNSISEDDRFMWIGGDTQQPSSVRNFRKFRILDNGSAENLFVTGYNIGIYLSWAYDSLWSNEWAVHTESFGSPLIIHRYTENLEPDDYNVTIEPTDSMLTFGGIIYAFNNTFLTTQGNDSGCYIVSYDMVPEQACSNLQGDICTANEYCPGNVLDATDTDKCCSQQCVIPTWDYCSDCGSGLFNLCDRVECNSITENCYFTPGLVGGCTNCAAATCENYEGEATCTENHCNLNNCQWDGDSCITGTVECNYNPDCGTNGFIGDYYCRDRNVTRDYLYHVCLYHGTVISECVNATVPTPIETCGVNEYCVDGEAECQLNETIECHADTDCGTNGSVSDYYCMNGNVVQDDTAYTCRYPGTVDSECINTTLPTSVEYCNQYEICVEGNPKCQLNVTCVDNDGGLNYSVKSNASTGVQTQFDICKNQTGANLIEGICDDNMPKGYPYMCPYGCEDGVCKEAENLSLIVKGRMIDAITEEPWPDIMLRNSDLGIFTTTDVDGRFNTTDVFGFGFVTACGLSGSVGARWETETTASVWTDYLDSEGCDETGRTIITSSTNVVDMGDIKVWPAATLTVKADVPFRFNIHSLPNTCLDHRHTSGKTEYKTEHTLINIIPVEHNVEITIILENGTEVKTVSDKFPVNQRCETLQLNYFNGQFSWGATPNLTCSDGTLSGQCSSTKPLYCDQGVLRPSCDYCGCSGDDVCNINGTCEAKTCFFEGGNICSIEEYCSGYELLVNDTERCCSEQCVVPDWPTCTECGTGLFNICDEIECNNIPENCEFTPSLVGGTCEVYVPEETLPDELGDCSLLSAEEASSICTPTFIDIAATPLVREACRKVFENPLTGRKLGIIYKEPYYSSTPQGEIDYCLQEKPDAVPIADGRGCLWNSGKYVELAGSKYVVAVWPIVGCATAPCTSTQMSEIAELLITKLYGENITLPPSTCIDGTYYGDCSITKPKYCSGGTLVNDCSTCSCPSGEECQTDGTCISTVETCTDGTPYGECSSTISRYCSDGNIINNCSSCGCPEGKECQPDGTCFEIGCTQFEGGLARYISDDCCPSYSNAYNDIDCCEDEGKCMVWTAYGPECYPTCDPWSGTCNSLSECSGPEKDGCCPSWCGVGVDTDCCESAGYCMDLRTDGSFLYLSCGSSACETEPADPTCSDGTPNMACSATQPLFCDQGTLEPACKYCGCPEGMGCDTAERRECTVDCATAACSMIESDLCCAPGCTADNDLDCCEQAEGRRLDCQSYAQCICVDDYPRCEDGTRYGRCSSNFPYYCDLDLNFEMDCKKCGCPEGEECQEDGSCLVEYCSDGTPYDECSSTKPKYCSNGVLADNCQTCGCEEGKICDADRRCYSKCSDGTRYDQCSFLTKPQYCDNGTLINDCNTCGCPSGETCQADGSCSVVENPTCSDGTLYNECSSIKPLYCQDGTWINDCNICDCPSGETCQADGTCQLSDCSIAECNTEDPDGCCPTHCLYNADHECCELYGGWGDGGYMVGTLYGMRCFPEPYHGVGNNCSGISECIRSQKDDCCPQWCSKGADADCCANEGYCLDLITDSTPYFTCNAEACATEPEDPTCSDGTVNFGCSETKPLFCDRGTFVPRCWTCGCPEGYGCPQVGAECTIDCATAGCSMKPLDQCCPEGCTAENDADCCKNAGRQWTCSPFPAEGCKCEDPLPTCSDGTLYARCSAISGLPLYCNEVGILEQACERCGCPEGGTCETDGSCSGVPSSAEPRDAAGDCDIISAEEVSSLCGVPITTNDDISPAPWLSFEVCQRVFIGEDNTKFAIQYWNVTDPQRQSTGSTPQEQVDHCINVLNDSQGKTEPILDGRGCRLKPDGPYPFDRFEIAGSKHLIFIGQIHNWTSPVLPHTCSSEGMDAITELIDQRVISETGLTCSDGTLNNECSSIKPYQCTNGTLTHNCNTCGCDSGQDCLENGGCVDPNNLPCSDGTESNQCSATKPLYCSNQELVSDCQACGCPAGRLCQPDGSCIAEAVGDYYSYDLKFTGPRNYSTGTGIVFRNGDIVYSDTYYAGKDKLYIINPSTGQITFEVEPEFNRTKGLAYGANSIYYFAYPNGPFAKLDVATLAHITTISNQVYWIRDITFDGSNLWAGGCDLRNTDYMVFKIDYTDGSITGSFTTPAIGKCVTGIAWDGNHLWISGEGEEKIYRVDPDTALLTGKGIDGIIKIYNWSFSGSIDWNGNSLWVAQDSNNFIYESIWDAARLEQDLMCSDGTLSTQCSSTVPLYCLNNNLITKCSACGCQNSYVCLANETCTPAICSFLDGHICPESEYCPGNNVSVTDTSRCCSEECVMPTWPSCNECGDGLFNICDRTECNSISENCYFDDELIGGSCTACAAATCESYGDDQQTCTENHCNLGNCFWSDTEDSCKTEFVDAECSNDEDCRYLDYVVGPGCVSGDVYQIYRNHTCINPGTESADCQTRQRQELIDECMPGEYCIHYMSECQQINLPETCNTDADCGDSGLVGEAYCSGSEYYQSNPYKVYLNYTCLSAANMESDCSSFSSIPCSNPPVGNSTECAISSYPKIMDVCQAEEDCVEGMSECQTETNGTEPREPPANVSEQTCNADSDCGTNEYTSGYYCLTMQVVRDYRYYRCLNPGTDNSTCQTLENPVLKDQCEIGEYCVLGVSECQNETQPSCVDGTNYSGCTPTKPEYCHNGALTDNCYACGCSEGEECQSGGSCGVSAPDTCTDGTLYGECSATKPLYCQEEYGILINDCSICGCPSGGVCREDGSCAVATCNEGTDCTIISVADVNEICEISATFTIGDPGSYACMSTINPGNLLYFQRESELGDPQVDVDNCIFTHGPSASAADGKACVYPFENRDGKAMKVAGSIHEIRFIHQQKTKVACTEAQLRLLAERIIQNCMA